MKETPYELLEDDEKMKFGKNNEAKTLYKALPRKEYERVFMCKTVKEFSILSEETIDSGFTRFNDIVTSLKFLDQDYPNKNHVRKFICALLLKWRAKVTAIEEAKDLATLPLDELISNLKVYEMILENDGVVSMNTKEKVKSLAHKAKVTRKQTSDNGDSQEGSDDDEDEDEDFNLMARNVQKFLRKGNRFGHGNRFGNEGNRFGRGRGNGFGNKGPKENKAFGGGAWSDSEHDNEPQKDATCLMAIDSQEVNPKPSNSDNDLDIVDLLKKNEEFLKFNKDFTKSYEKLLKEKRSLENEHSKLFSKINELKLEVKKLTKAKEVVEPCQKFEVLAHEVDSLRSDFSKLQDEALNFSKFKKSSVILDDMLSRQKLSQDKKGLGFSKNEKTLPLGSQGNANNRTRNEVSTTRVLELLNIDLFGPSPIQSYGGNFYTLMIVDDHSNYTWIVFVESKDDILEKLKILCIQLENLHDCSVVSIETNHSSEFDKMQFGSFCKQHGMSYNLSSPFTSQSNEIVARYSQASKAYIVLNKETMIIEESLNVTFDESMPEPKSSPSIEDDRINEPILHEVLVCLTVYAYMVVLFGLTFFTRGNSVGGYRSLRRVVMGSFFPYQVVSEPRSSTMGAMAECRRVRSKIKVDGVFSGYRMLTSWKNNWNVTLWRLRSEAMEGCDQKPLEAAITKLADVKLITDGSEDA
ncbi:zf-CCHC domain-containing protein [Tanacetum coccineum]|uniref:Zf-CCHC domain-containing protein n=1 Tax=Tanacetum coccineum TaxID=301880 RepID=A0ABQ5CZZ6_9ASTR